MKTKKKNKQLRAVQRKPYHIRKIRNPLPEIQLAAVKGNIEMIQYIKKPSRTVQVYVGARRPDLAKLFVHNKCDELKEMLLFKSL